jgi:hypothetical protein
MTNVLMAEPQRTYAVVVGIEQYNAGPEWDINGPANDARYFVDWLVRRQVPPNNILCFLSPLDHGENTKLLQWQGYQTRTATRKHVRSAFTQALRRTHGDLLYVFWSGHGVTTEEGRKLFYADATQEDKQNLDLTALLRFLRSDYFSRGFQQQICLITELLQTGPQGV